MAIRLVVLVSFVRHFGEFLDPKPRPKSQWTMPQNSHSTYTGVTLINHDSLEMCESRAVISFFGCLSLRPAMCGPLTPQPHVKLDVA
eukprot:257401-Pleurochrysis_carterae.AAC.2